MFGAFAVFAAAAALVAPHKAADFTKLDTTVTMSDGDVMRDASMDESVERSRARAAICVSESGTPRIADNWVRMNRHQSRRSGSAGLSSLRNRNGVSRMNKGPNSHGRCR